MRLDHGQFFGDYQTQRTVGALQLAELTPTVPEHEVHTHTHGDGHFLLLVAGHYLSTAKGMPTICTEPVLISNPPGTRHRDCFRGLAGCFLTLSVPLVQWAAVDDAERLSEQAIRRSGSALVAGYRLRRELRGWDSASALVVESEMQLLLSESALQTRFQDHRAPAWLARTREQLHDACADTPSLAALARTADVHPVHFARAFRRRYRCSPGEYLRRCRLERALGLLANRRLSLAEVAAQCGFFDQSHFNHAFQRAYRMTPGGFRALA